MAGDQTAPLRAPTGTHDVLWPESRRWERLVAEFARPGRAGRLRPRAQPHVRGRPALPPRHRRRQRRRPQGDVRVRATGAAAPWRCAPRARPRWCGPSSSTTRPCRGRRGTSRPPSATSAPRPAATGSTTSSGSRCSAPTTPTSTSRSSPWPPTSTPSWACGRSTWRSTRMGCADVPPRLPGRAAPPISTSTPASCATSTASATAVNPLRVLDCKRPECRAVTEDAPRIADYLDEACAAHLARVRAGLDAARGRLPARAPPRARPRLLHPHHLRVRRRGPRVGPERRRRRRAATTAWPRPSAGAPTRASASASASSGSCWPATPKGCSRPTPPSPDVFVVDVTGGATGPGPVRRAAPGRARRRGAAYDGRSLKVQFKQADRSGARFALIVGPDELAGRVVTVRPLRRRGAPGRRCRDADAGRVAAGRTPHDRSDRRTDQ